MPFSICSNPLITFSRFIDIKSADHVILPLCSIQRFLVHVRPNIPAVSERVHRSKKQPPILCFYIHLRKPNTRHFLKFMYNTSFTFFNLLNGWLVIKLKTIASIRRWAGATNG